jgi:hypothetical protein
MTSRQAAPTIDDNELKNKTTNKIKAGFKKLNFFYEEEADGPNSRQRC